MGVTAASLGRENKENFEKLKNLDIQDFETFCYFDEKADVVSTKNKLSALASKKLETHEEENFFFPEFTKAMLQKESTEVTLEMNGFAVGSAIALIEGYEGFMKISGNTTKKFWADPIKNSLALGEAVLEEDEKKLLQLVQKISSTASFPAKSSGAIIKEKLGGFVRSVKESVALVEANKGEIKTVVTSDWNAGQLAAGAVGAITGAVLSPLKGIASIPISLASSVGAQAAYKKLSTTSLWEDGAKGLKDGGKFLIGETHNAGRDILKGFGVSNSKSEKLGTATGIAGLVAIGFLLYKGVSAMTSSDDKKSSIPWKTLGVLGVLAAGFFGFKNLDFLKGLMPDLEDLVPDGVKETYDAVDKKRKQWTTDNLRWFKENNIPYTDDVESFLNNTDLYKIAGGLTISGIIAAWKAPKILGFLWKIKLLIGIPAALYFGYRVFKVFSSEEEAKKLLEGDGTENSFVKKGLELAGIEKETIDKTLEGGREFWDQNISPLKEKWGSFLSSNEILGAGGAEKLLSTLSLQNVLEEIQSNKEIQYVLKKNNTDVDFASVGFKAVATLAFFAIFVKALKVSKSPIGKIIGSILTSTTGKVVIGAGLLWEISKNDIHLSETTKEKFSIAFDATGNMISSAVSNPLTQEVINYTGSYFNDIKILFGLGDVKEIPESQTPVFIEDLENFLTKISLRKETPNTLLMQEKIQQILQVLKITSGSKKSLIDRSLFSEICLLAEAEGVAVKVEKKDEQNYLFSIAGITFPVLPFNLYPALFPLDDVPKEQTSFFIAQLEYLESEFGEYKEKYPQYKDALSLVRAEKKFIEENGYVFYTKEREQKFLESISNIAGVFVAWDGGDMTRVITVEHTERNGAEVVNKPIALPRSGIDKQTYLRIRPFMNKGRKFSGVLSEALYGIQSDLEHTIGWTLIENILQNTDKNEPLYIFTLHQKKQLETAQKVDIGELLRRAFLSNSYEISIVRGMISVVSHGGEELFLVPFSTLGKQISNIFDPDEEINWGKLLRESYIVPIIAVIGAKRGMKRGGHVAIENKSSEIVGKAKGFTMGLAKGLTYPVYIPAKHLFLTGHRLSSPRKYATVKGKNLLSHAKDFRSPLQAMGFTAHKKSLRILRQAKRLEGNIRYWTKDSNAKKSKFGMQGQVTEWRVKLEDTYDKFKQTDLYRSNPTAYNSIFEVAVDDLRTVTVPDGSDSKATSSSEIKTQAISPEKKVKNLEQITQRLLDAEKKLIQDIDLEMKAFKKWAKENKGKVSNSEIKEKYKPLQEKIFELRDAKKTNIKQLEGLLNDIPKNERPKGLKSTVEKAMLETHNSKYISLKGDLKGRGVAAIVMGVLIVGIEKFQNPDKEFAQLIWGSGPALGQLLVDIAPGIGFSSNFYSMFTGKQLIDDSVDVSSGFDRTINGVFGIGNLALDIVLVASLGSATVPLLMSKAAVITARMGVKGKAVLSAAEKIIKELPKWTKYYGGMGNMFAAMKRVKPLAVAKKTAVVAPIVGMTAIGINFAYEYTTESVSI